MRMSDIDETATVEGHTKHRSFIREPEDKRRKDLIRATLDCVTEKGLRAATVREVAARAGVTNGLIRHYFQNKDQMVQEAYRAMMRDMTGAVQSAVEKIDGSPKRRLREFIAANQSAPVLDIRKLSLWASFISLVHVDKAMAEIHRETYAEFRKVAELLVAEVFAEARAPITKEECERYAIKINAVVDGLWLEGCLADGQFDSNELESISIEAVQSILGMSLQDEPED